MSESTQKPCLVQTSQGFSLSYQNRFLYSKYAPQKAIEQAVANLSLLPGSLVICVSPCLWYGLSSLVAKLPADCFVLGIEADEQLYAFARAELKKIPSTYPVALLHPDELLDIVDILSQGKSKNGTVPPLHSFRRVTVVEMSGGASFHASLYKQLTFAAQNTIASFWKNRITLTKLGRLFSRNLFHNLAVLPQSEPLSHFLHTVVRPIIVFGAGESAGHTLADMSPAALQCYFVLAVDAAVPILKAHAVQPNAIVAVESQLAIEKAYIGCTDTQATIFADMASRQQVTQHTKGSVSYFASQFTTAHFLDDLYENKLLPPRIPALGSVGLTATYLALNLRATSDIPIYVTGLDFSFSLGATHARGAPAHIARLCKTNRLMPLANYDAAFGTGASTTIGKTGTVYTNQALSGYAQQFAHFFAQSENLYDIGTSGLPLGIATAPDFFSTKQSFQNHADILAHSQKNERSQQKSTELTAFFLQEKQSLERLKALLMHGETVASSRMSVTEEIATLLARKEYLYLHFPDGYACHADSISFLKRVRSEIDFFLKDIALALR